MLCKDYIRGNPGNYGVSRATVGDLQKLVTWVPVFISLLSPLDTAIFVYVFMRPKALKKA